MQSQFENPKGSQSRRSLRCFPEGQRKCSHGTCSTDLGGYWCRTCGQIADTYRTFRVMRALKYKTQPALERPVAVRARSRRRQPPQLTGGICRIEDPSAWGGSNGPVLPGHGPANSRSSVSVWFAKNASSGTTFCDFPSRCFCAIFTKLQWVRFASFSPGTAAHISVWLVLVGKQRGSVSGMCSRNMISPADFADPQPPAGPLSNQSFGFFGLEDIWLTLGRRIVPTGRNRAR